MPSFYPEGNAVKPTDNELRTLHKILDATSSSGGGGGDAPLSGSGSPEGVVAAVVGKTYVNTDNGDFYWKGSGSGKTGWLP